MKLRGAISGFGRVAALGHLPGWRARPRVEIVAVHEPLPERRHEALRLIRNVRVYESLELMLDGERLDFLDIASPPADHAAAARSALEARVHVLVEKPPCLERAEFERLTALAAARGRVMYCVHNWKHAPPYRIAHSAVTAGRLGAVSYVALNRLRTEQAGHSQWRVGDAGGGGGILIDHGWHVFYLMQWLMGGAPPSSVSSQLALAGGRVEEVADLRLTFPGARLGYSHLSWRAPVRRTSAVVYGDQGVLEIEGDRVVLSTRAGAAEDLSVADAPDDSYHSGWFASLAARFEQAIAQGPGSREMAENLAEARAALAAVVAARQSAAQGGISVEITINAPA